MSDPVIKSMVAWWFRLVAFSSFTAFLGVVVFVRVGVTAGTFTSATYMYVGATGVLMLLVLVWLKGKVDSAPEQIESFLRRLGLFKSP